MTDRATVEPTGTTRRAATLGSFTLGARLPDGQPRLNGVALFAVAGRAGTPYDGMSAFAFCAGLPEGNQPLFDRVTARLARVRELTSDDVVPVLEAGVAGRVAYSIEEAPAGERLSAWQERNRTPTPWIVSGLIGDVAAALQVAHDAGLSHGMIVPAVAWVDDDGKTRLGGFGLAGRGAELDQQQLAALTAELLAGAPLDLESVKGVAIPIAVERIRTHVNGLTERVATVIARGMASEPEQRFASVAEYAIAFRSEVVAAANDVAAGAWQALSLRDTAMAEVLIERIADYDPASSELPMLRVRMNDGLMAHPGFASAMFVESKILERDAPELDPMVATLKPPAGMPDSEEYRAAVRALLTPPPAVEPSRRKSSPWLLFLIGVCGLVIVFTVLVALTFSRL